MSLTPEQIAGLNLIVRMLTFISLYLIVGFGPGFILGLLAGNRLAGRGKPTYFETHHKNIARATEHNKQWSPTHEKWRS